ncbi:MAG TPA: hypothetical protein VIR61_03405 [Sulfuricaulis sp.]
MTCTSCEADFATASDWTDAIVTLVPSIASSAPGVGGEARHWPDKSRAAIPLPHEADGGAAGGGVGSCGGALGSSCGGVLGSSGGGLGSSIGATGSS